MLSRVGDRLCSGVESVVEGALVWTVVLFRLFIWSVVVSSEFCVCISVNVTLMVVSVSCSVLVFVGVCIFLLVVWREILMIGAGCSSVAFVLKVLSWSAESGGISLEFGKLCVYVGKW